VSERPVGFFDSGVGGLSVARELRRLLPGEDILYLADSAHCPYGVRPPAEIEALSVAAASFLVDRGAKLVVVACNTASTVALPALRARFEAPIVGMVPAVKPAAAATRSGQVAVLATPVTIGTETFAELVDRFAAGVRVVECPCPGLVEMVERAETEGPRLQDVLRGCLGAALEGGADTVVLGCTHYAFLRPAVERLAGPTVAVIDTGEPVARQAVRVLAERGLLAERTRPGRLEVHTTGEVSACRAVLAALLREPDFRPEVVAGAPNPVTPDTGPG
jgi:glutamate racemase